MHTDFEMMVHSSLNHALKRVWIWIAILTAIVWLYPIEYQVTRFAVSAGVAVTWTGALLLWWRHTSEHAPTPEQETEPEL